MVFVPLPYGQAVALRAGSTAASGDGFAATPSQRATLGTDVSEEEAEYAALSAAGVAALDGLVGSRRLVAAVEADAAQVSDRGAGLGEVVVDRLGWAQVRALFADEDEAAQAVVAAATASAGVPLVDALELSAVVALTDRYDLLWYAPEELDELV